ncbi:hypothetical protein [uncultured Draconibacterium sp.]|uniref:HzsA-related protein n=1 Tax=uncultured Draconibacterium sp. TaxID=1573823 RepID=UPI003216BB17
MNWEYKAGGTHLFGWLVLVFFGFSCSTQSFDGMLLVAVQPTNTSGLTVLGENGYVAGSKIVAIHPESPNANPIELTNDFFAATAPELSYDGKRMLFSAQKSVSDKWQIWEMTLSGLQAQQLSHFTEDCISPVYLPGDRFVFSSFLKNDTVKNSFAVFQGKLDGSQIQQVSYDPQNHTALSVLKDGRVLSITQQVYPLVGDDKFMVMRPDGTKLELFCAHNEMEIFRSSAHETNDGKIVFVSENGNTKKSDLVSVDYNMPFHSRNVLSPELAGDFLFVRPGQNGQLLTSYLSESAQEFQLYSYDVEMHVLTEIWQYEEFDVLDALFIQAFERPRNLPSEVNSSEETGLLMCQDINFSGLESMAIDDKQKAQKIEIIGTEGSLGKVNVESDGSFYLKVDANLPFRIQTLSAEGEVIKGPGSWYYIRPNERRACVGCHTGTEISPFNQQPVSVRKDPVLIPVQKTLNK